jgi:sulfur carrier protein
VNLVVSVNGSPLDLLDGSTVAQLVQSWCKSPDGIAVARNGEVVPKSQWGSTALESDDRVEIVTAAAGG